MNWLRQFLFRLRALFRREKLDAEMSEEMRAHLEMQAAANRAAGMSTDEAHYAAQRQFGGIDQIKETARDQRGWVWLEQLGKDLQLACRTLRKSPGFTAVAVSLLALGIGSNAAFFSLFKAHALTPFPYPNPSKIVQLWGAHESMLERNPWSTPDFLDIHRECKSLAESGAFNTEAFNLGGENPGVLHGVACTPGVLRALGVQPLLGRWFADSDVQPGALATVILSHACWTQHFGAMPRLVGQSIRLNAQDYVVAGVMPADFEFYSPYTGPQAIDLWVPLQLGPAGRSRDDHWLKAVGRLKDGVTIESTNTELKLIAGRLATAFPDTNYNKWFYARPLPAEITVREVFGYGPVVAAVWLALIVACANLAIMLLARGAGRQTEYGVRLALGATRWRLIRLALAESLIISLLGGTAGLLLARGSFGVLTAFYPPSSTHGGAVQIDSVVIGYALLLAIVASLAAGLPPAWTAAKIQVLGTIKQGGLTQAGSRTRHRFLRHLVSTQVAIALLLVNTTALLLASYRAALVVNEPLSSEFVLAASIATQGTRYDAGEARVAFWQRFVERVKALPGVTAVGMTWKLPLRGGYNTQILADGETFDPKVGRPPIEMSFASANYFAAMGITRLRGRTFADADARNDTLGVVVNRALADHYWPNQDPIGQRIRGNTLQPWFTARVVGVVDNVRQWDIGRPALPEIDFPYAWNPQSTAYLVVRSAFDARRMAPALRHELAALDPDLALTEPTTMAEIVSEAARSRRTLLLLTQFFMAVTLLMAAVGIYGTLAFQTRQRTREIGVRLALGAARPDIVRLVLQQAVPWVVGGGAAGMIISAAVAYALRMFFADISLLNPLYFLGGSAILGAAVALACWLPARRATKVNPVEALRAE
jgi:putative ABC transport system permease protein